MALLVIWQISSSLGLLSPPTLASPVAAVASGADMLADGTLMPHLLASAERAYLGLGLSVAAGLVCGVLLAGLTLPACAVSICATPISSACCAWIAHGRA